MKVYQDSSYSAEFPETYDWNMVDSIKISKIAIDIKGWIQHCLKTETRSQVPGLRKALNIIAEKAELI